MSGSVGRGGLLDRLVRDLSPLVDEAASLIMSLPVGGAVSLNSDEWVKRRKNGFYLVDGFRGSADPIDPDMVVYLFLMDGAARAVRRLYVQGVFQGVVEDRGAGFWGSMFEGEA